MRVLRRFSNAYMQRKPLGIRRETRDDDDTVVQWASAARGQRRDANQPDNRREPSRYGMYVFGGGPSCRYGAYQLCCVGHFVWYFAFCGPVGKLS